MTDGPRHVTQLDVYRAIGDLKASMDGKFERIDERLRAIESTAPSSFGPRLGAMERWKDLADGPDDRLNLPAWRNQVDDRLQQIAGIGKLVRWGGALVTAALGIIGLAQWLRVP